MWLLEYTLVQVGATSSTARDDLLTVQADLRGFRAPLCDDARIPLTAWPVHWAHPLSPPGLVSSTTSSTLSLCCCCTHHYTSRLEALVARSGVSAASLPPPQQRSAHPYSLHCKDGGLDREEPGAQVPRRRAVPAGQGDARCLKFADNHFSPSSPRRSRAGRNSCSCKSSSLGSRFEPHLLLKLANNQFKHKVRHS